MSLVYEYESLWNLIVFHIGGKKEDYRTTYFLPDARGCGTSHSRYAPCLTSFIVILFSLNPLLHHQ